MNGRFLESLFPFVMLASFELKLPVFHYFDFNNYKWIKVIWCLHIYIYISIYFKNTKNLFIHIALIPEGDNPRVNPNILKCLLHSLVGEGVSASGDRLQSDSVQDTHPLPHS